MIPLNRGQGLCHCIENVAGVVLVARGLQPAQDWYMAGGDDELSSWGNLSRDIMESNVGRLPSHMSDCREARILGPIQCTLDV